jgi:hypothetical protein
VYVHVFKVCKDLLLRYVLKPDDMVRSAGNRCYLIMMDRNVLVVVLADDMGSWVYGFYNNTGTHTYR